MTKSIGLIRVYSSILTLPSSGGYIMAQFNTLEEIVAHANAIREEIREAVFVSLFSQSAGVRQVKILKDENASVLRYEEREVDGVIRAVIYTKPDYFVAAVNELKRVAGMWNRRWEVNGNFAIAK